MDILNVVIAVAACVFAGFQGVTAVYAVRDSRRAQRMEDTARVLALHGAMTTREVVELRLKHERDRSEVDKHTVVAVFNRVAAELPVISRSGHVDKGDLSFVMAEKDVFNDDLKDLPEAQPARDKLESAEKPGLRSGSDRSRYAWDGRGKLSKIATLELIARSFARAEGVSGAGEFEEKFAAHLKSVLKPDLYSKLTLSKLLILASSDPNVETWVKKADEIDPDNAGALHFGGSQYAIDWWLGLGSVAAVGVSVHKPTIEYFAARGRPVFPITSV